MNYPKHRIYEAIAAIKTPGVWRLIAPAAPMTEADFEAFHALCRMWSRMWGGVQHNLMTVNQNDYEEANHVD
ncbi:MAG: hypothetical protein HXY40_08835 [Chloroflexi bacterium]|nr:hypothetical protein [Chloroflexota bacterium]